MQQWLQVAHRCLHSVAIGGLGLGCNEGICGGIKNMNIKFLRDSIALQGSEVPNSLNKNKPSTKVLHTLLL